MILITDGAYYIGSHVVKQLLEPDKNIIVVDNLSTGFQNTIETLQKIKKFDFIKLDLKEFDKDEKLFKKYKINTVIHFASFSQVDETMQNPIKYYMNITHLSEQVLKDETKVNYDFSILM